LRQISYLRDVKAEHGLSMASQIRGMIQREIYGLGGQSVDRSSDSEKKRMKPIATDNAAYSSVVREMKCVLEERRRRAQL
jgi:hypothetical protein